MIKPSFFFVLSACIAIVALGVMFWPQPGLGKAMPLPVLEEDREVVWLYPATNPAPWERFVTAAAVASGPNGWTLDRAGAFPKETTAVPQLRLHRQGQAGSIWIRWYKLARDSGIAAWTEALLKRPNPPLVVIGGSSSDNAIELGQIMETATNQSTLGDSRPLLWLTQATADVNPNEIETPLTAIYPGRTFRFCFSNRQMARSVVQFIFEQPELMPDSDPAYLTFWRDDPYSRDLNHRFIDALGLPAAISVAGETAQPLGVLGTGAFPLDLAKARLGTMRLDSLYSASIPFSVGGYERPNRWEAEESLRLMKTKLTEFPKQSQPLLVIPAASQPARRFLRGLVRAAPDEARRFRVVTGDSISFNLIFRDRQLAWPIQDLPFHLAFFAHRSPIDPAAGFPLERVAKGNDFTVDPAQLAATDDLLLYEDLINSLLLLPVGGGLPDATRLGEQLRRLTWDTLTQSIKLEQGTHALFDDLGSRADQTGEHLVWLKPRLDGAIVPPQAVIELWRRSTRAGQAWQRVTRLPVGYEGPHTTEFTPF